MKLSPLTELEQGLIIKTVPVFVFSIVIFRQAIIKTKASECCAVVDVILCEYAVLLCAVLEFELDFDKSLLPYSLS